MVDPERLGGQNESLCLWWYQAMQVSLKCLSLWVNICLTMKLSQWGERWQGGFTRNISWHFHATAQLCFIELVLVSKVVSQRNVFVLRVCFPKQYLDCSISVAWLQGWQHKFVIHWPLISITEWSFVQTFMDPRTWICLTLLIVKLGGHGPHHLGSDFTQLQANSEVRKGMKSLKKHFI